MKKKGFTLVELLAVILILGIIALIAIPIVSNVIQSARKNATIDSANAIAKSYDYYLVEKKLPEGTRVDVKDLDVKHNDFTSGTVYSSNNEVILENVSNNKYCINGMMGDYNIVKGPCDTNKPIVSLVDGESSFISGTDKDVDSFFNIDSNGASGIKSTICKIKDTDTVISNIKDLEAGNYTISCVISKNNNTDVSIDKTFEIKPNELVVFNNGVTNYTFTVLDTRTSGYTYGKFSIDDSCLHFTKSTNNNDWVNLLVIGNEAIDVTSYNKMIVTFKSYKLTGTNSSTYTQATTFKFGIVNNKEFSGGSFKSWAANDKVFAANSVNSVASGQNETFEIDISSITGEVYLGFMADGGMWTGQTHNNYISYISFK